MSTRDELEQIARALHRSAAAVQAASECSEEVRLIFRRHLSLPADIMTVALQDAAEDAQKVISQN